MGITSMKSHEKAPVRLNSRRNHRNDKVLQRHEVKDVSHHRSRKKPRETSITYEEGDLRGIVAAALTKSTDPYRALCEAGVIKDAAEFFDNADN